MPGASDAVTADGACSGSRCERINVRLLLPLSSAVNALVDTAAGGAVSIRAPDAMTPVSHPFLDRLAHALAAVLPDGFKVSVQVEGIRFDKDGDDRWVAVCVMDVIGTDRSPSRQTWGVERALDAAQDFVSKMTGDWWPPREPGSPFAMPCAITSGGMITAGYVLPDGEYALQLIALPEGRQYWCRCGECRRLG